MSIILFADGAASTLAGSITNTALTANLASGTGVLFPAPGAGQYFALTFSDAATGLVNEIVHVTNVTGDTITMVRAQEGTVGLAWSAGDLADNLLTAATAAAFVQKAGLQNQVSVYAIDTGAANAYVVTLSPAPTALTAGMRVAFKAVNANTTASTLNLNALGATAIKRRDGTALQSGDIPAGSMCDVEFDGTNFQLMSALATGIKALFNFQQIINTTRASVSGSVANTYVSAVSGSVTKQSATSILVFWLLHPTYVTSVGATLAKFAVGAQSQIGVNGGSTSGAATPGVLMNGAFTGLAAGALAWALSYARGDGNAYTNTANPTTADNAYFPSGGTQTVILFAEYEP